MTLADMLLHFAKSSQARSKHAKKCFFPHRNYYQQTKNGRNVPSLFSPPSVLVTEHQIIREILW